MSRQAGRIYKVCVQHFLHLGEFFLQSPGLQLQVIELLQRPSEITAFARHFTKGDTYVTASHRKTDVASLQDARSCAFPGRTPSSFGADLVSTLPVAE